MRNLTCRCLMGHPRLYCIILEIIQKNILDMITLEPLSAQKNPFFSNALKGSPAIKESLLHMRASERGP